MRRHQEAIDALCRARATADCCGSLLAGCAFGPIPPIESETVCGMSLTEWTIEAVHWWHASLLLDGLSVADVTAAEEALDG